MAIDPQTQQNVNDFQLYVKDTLMSISAKFSEAMADAVEDAFDNLDKKVISAVEKDLTKTFKNLVKASDDISLNMFKLKQGLIGAKDLARQQVSIDEKRILLESRIAHAKMMGAKFSEEDVEAARKALDFQEAQLAAAIAYNAMIEKRLGITGKLVGALGKIPGVGQFIKADELETELRAAAANGAGQFKVMGVAAKNAFGQITKGLTDPLFLLTAQITLFKKIFDISKELNEQFTGVRRQLVLSEEATNALYQKAADYAAVSKDSFVTNKMLLESQLKLNQTLGTSVNLGNENAEAFGRLTHFYGLSEEAASKLVELGVEQKKNGVDILNTVNKTVLQTKAAVGGSISYQKVLEKVSSTSAGLLTNFKGNVGELAKAIVQANRLGLTLEEVNQIGESLLNFEQSIESELKAELLLGKSINLEKARAAALSGDTAKLTQEIANQVGNIHQFEKLNVIQRKAYAEVFGMNVDQMASMLRKREFEKQMGDAINKSAKEQLEYATKNGIKLEDSVKQQLEAKSLADEQHELFESLNGLIARITKGPMGVFIHMLEKALGFAGGIIDSLNQLSGGGLGNALGAAIIGAPLLIGAARGITSLFSGGISGLFKKAPMPVVVVNDGFGGGAGGQGDGVLDMVTGGGGRGGFKKGLVRRFGAKGARNLLRGGFAAGGIGLGVGLLSSQIASGMEEGTTERNITEGIGTTASYAGTGAMIGSIIPGVGTVIGGIIGGSLGAIKSYFDAENEKREREKREKEENKASAERIDKLIASVSDISQRPLVFNAGTDTIARLQTAQRQYGAPAIAG